MRCPRWIVSAASTDTRYDQPVIVHKALDGQEARAILELLHLVRVGPRWLGWRWASRARERAREPPLARSVARVPGPRG